VQLLKVIYISQALAPMRRAGRSAAHAASHGLECSWQPRRPRWSAGGRAGSTAVGTRPEHAVLRCMSLLAVPKAAFGCLARAYTHQTAEDGGLQVAPGSPSRRRTRMRPPFVSRSTPTYPCSPRLPCPSRNDLRGREPPSGAPRPHPARPACPQAHWHPAAPCTERMERARAVAV